MMARLGDTSRVNPSDSECLEMSHQWYFHDIWDILTQMTPRCIAKLRPAAERANLFGGD